MTYKIILASKKLLNDYLSHHSNKSKEEEEENCALGVKREYFFLGHECSKVQFWKNMIR